MSAAAATWEFVKRHKGKIITGAVIVGGAVAYATSQKQSNPQLNLENSHTLDDLKVQARRHYVFDTNHRSCDQSIIDMVPTIKQLVQARFDVDSLIRKIQNDFTLTSQQKVDIWQEIKVLSVARLVALAYSYSMLTVTLKAQISILATEICSQFESPKKHDSGWKSYLPSALGQLIADNGTGANGQVPSFSGADAGCRQIFLQCIQYFTTKGIFRLFDLIETATKEECVTIPLTEIFNRESIRALLDRIDKRVVIDLQTELKDMIAPITPKEATSNDGVMRLLGRLIAALESSWCHETVPALVDYYFSAACHKVSESSEALARVLPSVADAFEPVSGNSFDSPLQNTLCSSDIHFFAMNVFSKLK